MSKRRSHRPRKRHLIVDHGRIDDIPRSRAAYQQILKYRWEWYSELAFQRAHVYDGLKASLRERTTGSFRIERWQRSVKYRYSLNPLSARGSLSGPGGRFNIGDIDPSRYSIFPALYLAADKDTALDEMFGRSRNQELQSFDELALARADSVAVISVSGILESVLDLRDASNLSSFVALTKHFSISKALLEEANRIGQDMPRIANTVAELMNTILESNWRFSPMQWDVPSNSQILGQIAMGAGIEGIIYPSSLTKQPCIAVFPQNFSNSSSFLQIDDPLPEPSVKHRIDKDTFKTFL